VDHLAHDLVFRHDRVYGGRDVYVAVIAEQRIPVLEQPASSQAQPPRFYGVVLGVRTSVDIKLPKAQLKFLSGKAHDAFDKQFDSTSRHDQIATLEVCRAVSPSVHDEQVPRPQSWKHAVALDQR
jgi:hypothetical protein